MCLCLMIRSFCNLFLFLSLSLFLPLSLPSLGSLGPRDQSRESAEAPRAKNTRLSSLVSCILCGVVWWPRLSNVSSDIANPGCRLFRLLDVVFTLDAARSVRRVTGDEWWTPEETAIYKLVVIVFVPVYDFVHQLFQIRLDNESTRKQTKVGDQTWLYEFESVIILAWKCRFIR